MGDVLGILPISVEDVTHQEDGSLSSVPHSSIVLSEIEQIKNVEASFNSPSWLF